MIRTALTYVNHCTLKFADEYYCKFTTQKGFEFECQTIFSYLTVKLSETLFKQNNAKCSRTFINKLNLQILDASETGCSSLIYSSSA
uniref:Bm13077 n=1 Tax=Brugia malayi TaxID=6279 RepID=A0A1I9G1U6_BRUMA|nr:Bm13077 [Brugia malayi]